MSSLRFVGFLAVAVLLLFYMDVGETYVSWNFFKNESHPGKCYINEKLILDEDDKRKDLEFCNIYYCRDAVSGLVELQVCVDILPPTNCKWTNAVDVKATFPLCCLMNYYCANPNDVVEAHKMQEYLKEQFQAGYQIA